MRVSIPASWKHCFATMCWLEILGFVTALVLILKSVYNLSHFVYVNFLGRLLGHGLNISKCGPWAGNLNIAKKSKFIIMFIHFFLNDVVSGNGCNRRNRKILCSFGNYLFNRLCLKHKSFIVLNVCIV